MIFICNLLSWVQTTSVTLKYSLGLGCYDKTGLAHNFYLFVLFKQIKYIFGFRESLKS